MGGGFRATLDWLSILGIPSIFALVAWCIRISSHYAKEMKVLIRAQQAQMRSQLLDQYHIYMDQGWISEEHMEDWENQYQAYHSLGENGVLDSRRDKLLQLPSEKKEANDL